MIARPSLDLAVIGRTSDTRRLCQDLLHHRNHAGLLSKDLDPTTVALWRTFPRTYSMAGMIVTAMRLPNGWEHAR